MTNKNKHTVEWYENNQELNDFNITEEAIAISKSIYNLIDNPDEDMQRRLLKLEDDIMSYINCRQKKVIEVVLK